MAGLSPEHSVLGREVMALVCPQPHHDLEHHFSLMEFTGTVTFWRNYFYKSVKHLKDSAFQ